MAALVQTIPQQSGTVPVLQTRPSSSSGTFASPSQTSQQQASRNQTMSWTSFNTVGGSGNARGHAAVAPYAFTSTPNLATANNAQNRQSWTPHLRPEHRTSSAPSVPQGSPNPAYNPRFVNHPAAGSVSTSSSSSLRSYLSKDDTAIPSRDSRGEAPLRPLSTVNIPTPSFMNISSPTVGKPSPDRYRRGNRRGENATGVPASISPGSMPVPAVTIEDLSAQTSRASPVEASPRGPGHVRVSSADDTTRTEKSQPELAKRYRRRSWGTMDSASLASLQLQMSGSQSPSATSDIRPLELTNRPPSVSSQRDGSGSIHSTHSSTDSVRETAVTDSTAKTENAKRMTKPSPLSQAGSTVPQTPENPQSDKNESAPSSTSNDSPATQRLGELTKNDPKKGKSRLRRAFSFGSAAELRKASAQSNLSKREALAAEQFRREQLQEELGPEQAAIAAQQEASGLGESIYSHHQGFFTGSTDNLSISSTASSASIMLRKMGKGMKRGTRSLVGLFRPKPLVSTSSSDGIVAPMAPQLSVVNVEAEKSVSVNPDPQDLPRGGTVFPKVEAPAPSGSRPGSIREASGADKSNARKSIVGGDKERAEVLAAVRKGILKKTHSDPGNSSPSIKPMENGSDSPHSSAPSTPEDQTRSGHKRRDSVKIAGEDYFLSEGRFAGSEVKSAPITPAAVAARNIVFSPRIQFHETWPSGEYDRRGEIATCNRLTPLLAQQIKEELNNFKMEMEVHETSKIYTHFL